MEFNFDLTTIISLALKVVISAIIAFLTSKVVPFIREKGLYKYAKMLVSVAYTLYKSGEGEKKMQYVLDKLKASKYAKFFDFDKLYEYAQSAYVELCTELGKTPSQAYVAESTDTEAEKK